MKQAIQRPRAFISSTITDLRDVRSAIRYWLEGAGYDVQLSEYNDFDRRPEDATFAACFDNVASADYYILLIGAERGSWYDEASRISVTRQEFRVAQATAAQRPLATFVFLRQEVATALKQWDADGRPEPEASLVRDPHFTSEFLQEVQALGEVPSEAGSRWIYKFNDFRDIIDGLRVPLRLDLNIERRLLTENLTNELLCNLSLLCTRTEDGAIFPNHWWTDRERREITIPDKDATGTIRLSAKQAGRVGLLALVYPGSLRRDAIEEALRAGLFLSFDVQTGGIGASEGHTALQALRDDIEALVSQGESKIQQDVLNEFMALARQANSGRFPAGTDVDAMKLTMLLALHDRILNVFNATAQFCKWLLGAAESPTVARARVSPIEGMSEQIEAETVTTKQLRWALVNGVHPFGARLTPATRELVSGIEEKWARELRTVIPEDLMDDDKLRELVEESLDKLVVEESSESNHD